MNEAIENHDWNAIGEMAENILQRDGHLQFINFYMLAIDQSCHDLYTCIYIYDILTNIFHSSCLMDGYNKQIDFDKRFFNSVNRQH